MPASVAIHRLQLPGLAPRDHALARTIAAQVEAIREPRAEVARLTGVLGR
jgi:hypothetical protein